MPLSVFFIILFIIGTALSAVLFLPVTLVFHGFYQEHFVLKLHIRFFGKNIKSLRLYPKKKKQKRDRGQTPGSYNFTRLLKKTETAFFVKCHIGLADAASTAISTGILQGIFSTALPVVEHFTQMKKQQVEIVPSFYQRCFIFNGICIARTKLGHIIYGFLHYKKAKRK